MQLAPTMQLAGAVRYAACLQLLAIVGSLAAGAAIYWVEPWLYPLLIILGFIVTNITNRKSDLTLKVRCRHGASSVCPRALQWSIKPLCVLWPPSMHACAPVPAHNMPHTARPRAQRSELHRAAHAGACAGSSSACTGPCLMRRSLSMRGPS